MISRIQPISCVKVRKKATVVVANDSGVSHIAAAVSAPQITLIGVTDITRTSPWNSKAGVLGNEKDGWPSVETVLGELTRLCAA